MTDINLEELKILAEAADQDGQHIYDHPRDSNNWKANEAWIAAANPQTVLALVEMVENLNRENEVLWHEREHERANRDHCVRILTRIHSFMSPADVALPDGRRFEFNNPAIEHDMLKALSDAIRAVPEELAKGVKA